MSWLIYYLLLVLLLFHGEFRGMCDWYMEMNENTSSHIRVTGIYIRNTVCVFVCVMQQPQTT